MLVVGINNSAHSVIPDLDGSIVQRGKEPWSLGMETEAFDTGCLGVKLGQHPAVRHVNWPAGAKNDEKIGGKIDRKIALRFYWARW